MTPVARVNENCQLNASVALPSSASKASHWRSFERLRHVFDFSSVGRAPDTAVRVPASLLHAVENDPQRMKPITDALAAAQQGVMNLGHSVYARFSSLGGSFADIFCINAFIDKLKQASVSSLVEAVSPYLLVGLSHYLIASPKDEAQKTQSDIAKFAASCIILGYSMTHRLTEHMRTSHVAMRVLQRAASIWSLINMHVIGYNTGYAAADRFLVPLQADNLITDDTKNSLNLLSGIIATSAVLPKIMLLIAQVINQQLLKKDSLAGIGTQSSRSANIPNGLTSEVNLALQLDDHLLHQLSDAARLFQYLIVTLNVLKDVDIPDPSAAVSIKKDSGDLFVKKTRNVWLLTAESFLKAKNDISSRLSKIAKDSEINRQQYTVVRDGIKINHVYRSQLQVGDLVSLEDASSSVYDPVAETTRTKATLSGYLVQLGGAATSKQVAINLAELNGESKPVILAPSRQAKAKTDCVPMDLHTVANTGAIFPGTEFLSFDNGNPVATAENLYLQIAATHQQEHVGETKIPISAQQITDLKTQLIKGVLAISALATAALMKKHTGTSDFTKLVQYYGTEFLDKFTQVFVEAQTLIPLTSDVVLELTNSELLRNLNQKLDDKILLNNALCMADVFEPLHKRNVRIYSDKTGTVTETFMHMRDIVCHDSIEARDRVLTAFATTFSDQKTEAEENEIRRYYTAEKSVKIDSKYVVGQLDQLEKTISKASQETVRFITKRVGLFTDFGGQFTIREQEGKPPVLVFCGAPKAEDGGEKKFYATKLLEAHQAYEQQQQQLGDQQARQDSLTRDWSIAEMPLTAETHQALLEAIEQKDPDESRRLIKALLNEFTKGFEYLGTFQIDNPIKPGAREAIQKWNQAGIGFMMITGDTKNAARMIAAKLFPDRKEHIFDSDELQSIPLWEELDLLHSTVILTDTKPKTMELLDQLEALGDKKPNIIFCQMKDVDKKNLVVHAKEKGKFVIANGDGCNDLHMLKAAHIAIGDAARDGSFARDVQEASTFTDTQLRQLMKAPGQSLYQLLDLHEGKNSTFLQHFAPLANTQPKVITSLLGKPLKSVAVPRALGRFTKEIPGQFGVLLGYDAAFLAAAYQANIATAHTPLVDSAINKSKLPWITLASAAGIAAAQSIYCYHYQDQQVTTGFMLLGNLAASIGCLALFLAPPGYAPKKPSTESVQERNLCSISAESPACSISLL